MQQSRDTRSTAGDRITKVEERKKIESEEVDSKKKEVEKSLLRDRIEIFVDFREVLSLKEIAIRRNAVCRAVLKNIKLWKTIHYDGRPSTVDSTRLQAL